MYQVYMSSLEKSWKWCSAGWRAATFCGTGNNLDSRDDFAFSQLIAIDNSATMGIWATVFYVLLLQYKI